MLKVQLRKQFRKDLKQVKVYFANKDFRQVLEKISTAQIEAVGQIIKKEDLKFDKIPLSNA
jgi:hypothetical protein